MRKILAVLLLLAMTLSLFTGCSREKLPPETEDTASRDSGTLPETEEPSEEEETRAEKTEEPATEPAGTQAATEEEPATEAPVTEQETELKNPLDREDPVSELYSEEKEGFYEYHVPQLNCGTADAENINREIDEIFGREARDGIEAGKDGLNTGCYEIQYTVHWYGDVMVLLVWSLYNNDFRVHQVYSIYCVTGCRMDNAGILRMLNIAPEDLVPGAQHGAEAWYREYYPEETMGGDSMYEEQLEWTLSPENINPDMMMFPGEDGQLMLISKIGSLAGASYYEQVYAFRQP